MPYLSKVSTRGGTLLVCSTPLHLMIAEEVLKRGVSKASSIDLALFQVSRSEQVDYYLARVQPLVTEVIRIEPGKKFPSYAYELWKKFRHRSYDCAYIPNPSSVNIQFLLSYCRFHELRTFDDGSANIDRDSVFYKRQKNLSALSGAGLKSFAQALIGRRYDTQALIQLSTHHYSIYKGMPNIIENVEFLNLFAGADRADIQGQAGVEEIGDRGREELVLFLGTVINGHSGGRAVSERFLFNIQSYINTLAAAQRVFYVRHPREQVIPFNNVQEYETVLAAEELIMAEVAQGKKITLIGFPNSTQFAMLSRPHIVQKCLFSSQLPHAARKRAKTLEWYGVELIEV